MTLYDGQKGEVYEVSGVYVEEPVTRRLQALGLNDGTKAEKGRRTDYSGKRNPACAGETYFFRNRNQRRKAMIDREMIDKDKTVHVAFVGNPNCGKTTLFHA